MSESRDCIDNLQRQVADIERYAGKMEAALEHVRTVCRLATRADELCPYADVFDVIASLALVKDEEGSDD